MACPIVGFDSDLIILASALSVGSADGVGVDGVGDAAAAATVLRSVDLSSLRRLALEAVLLSSSLRVRFLDSDDMPR